MRHRVNRPFAQVFNPATLSLSGWWRASYASSPWAGVASAGASGGRDLTEATNPPSSGTAVNGFNPADFDGSNDRIDNALDPSDFFGAAAGSCGALIYADAASADGGDTAPYNMPALITDAGEGRLALAYGDSGARFGFFNSTHGTWESLAVACSTGAWHFVQAKYDSTNLHLRVDGGSWSTEAFAFGPTWGVGTFLRVGGNFSPTLFFDGKILEVFTSTVALSNASFDNFRSYFLSRYGLSV